ncbi:hypothetical protein CAPTEDRAFT_188708 [Capitella teleta]|uniref:CARD domain-containing protein n=1 Tax=Capitella teleta TaxID=283909 RepID=R7TBY0_CAPTE|nr:hypothetical protein CAPTEDRAFT_188708 [Capitella teleta]|eukprot:ELT88997.1 hypothetical protein CAPTEDRAFT_188708 [Capitella teleta]
MTKEQASQQAGEGNPAEEEMAAREDGACPTLHAADSPSKQKELEKAIGALETHIDVLWAKLEMPEQDALEEEGGNEDEEEENEDDPEGNKREERCLRVLRACLDAGRRCEVMELLRGSELSAELEAVSVWLDTQDKKDAGVEEVEETEESSAPPLEPTKPRMDHRKILEMTKATFIDTMLLDREMIRHLKENSILNDETSSRVLCRPSRPDKVKCLFNLLKELGPKSLLVFIDSLLLTNQQFLAKILATEVAQTS